jgi:hypothetical protein
MAERESRKRKVTELGAQYQQDMAKSAVKLDNSKKSRTIGKEVNTDLAAMFGNMKASEAPPAAMDVEMDMAARGRRRRKTRKGSKKSRKGRKKTRKH